MKNKLLLWAITSALAGFIFGFDLIVISGGEKKIQSLWNLSDWEHGLAISAALWGTVVGSMFGSLPADRFGRRKTLLAIGILYFASAIGSAVSGGLGTFVLARMIGGLGIGISTVASPLFISEISPADRRGRLAGLFQFNIVFGILIAFLSNALIGATMGENAWRWMLAVEAIPAFIFGVLCFKLPESPRWLIQNGRIDEGKKVLLDVNPGHSEAEIEQLSQEILHANEKTSSNALSWKRLRIPICLAFFIAFFNQLSGINAIIGFAPRIFQQTGLGEQAALLQSVGIGVTNFIFTFLGLALIDRLGRRTLLLLGSFGYIASLALCAWAFFAFAGPFKVGNAAIQINEGLSQVQNPEATPAELEKAEKSLTEARESLVTASEAENYQGDPINIPADSSYENLNSIANTALTKSAELSSSGSLLVMVCIFAFIAAHAVGQGAVIWVFISEIFPSRARASGQALGSATHWVFAAMLTFVFPMAVAAFEPGYIFAFFCGMMILQLLWVVIFVPETKGVQLEEMEQKLGLSSESTKP